MARESASILSDGVGKTPIHVFELPGRSWGNSGAEYYSACKTGTLVFPTCWRAKTPISYDPTLQYLDPVGKVRSGIRPDMPVGATLT
jgi:hypothetical protein